MLFGAGSDTGVLFRDDSDDAGGDFVVDYSLVVLAYDVDVDSEFLGGEVSKGLKS
jgi:hypothetical protein